jgi:hypothetical protein
MREAFPFVYLFSIMEEILFYISLLQRSPLKKRKDSNLLYMVAVDITDISVCLCLVPYIFSLIVLESGINCFLSFFTVLS